MLKEWQLKTRLNWPYADMVFAHTHSEDYINYGPEKGKSNWQLHDEVIENMTSLKMEWIPEPLDASWAKDLEVAGKVYQNALQWLFVNIRIARFFSYRFFRQSELCFGWLSVFAERLRLLTFLFQVGKNLKTLDEFDPFSMVHSELYFYEPKNRLRPSETMIFMALQQAFLEREVYELVFAQFEPSHPLAEEFAKAVRHFEFQQEFFLKELQKTLELFPERRENLKAENLPRLHFMEKFMEFGRLSRSAETSKPGWTQGVYDHLRTYLEEAGFAILPEEVLGEENWKLSRQEQKVYAAASANTLQTYRRDVSRVIEEAGIENDRILQDCLRQVSANQTYKEHFNTGIYEYYLFEQSKIYWQLQHVKEFMGESPRLNPEDHDYELFDIIKEIAYCEAATYTIGFSNMMHLGTMHPFVLWNSQQCHEELKHFHTIRWILNEYGVQTDGLDEFYLAQENVEPTPQFFVNEYDVVMINFLGETHNIRAYLMLADSMKDKSFKKVMRWIAEDEVVHKKVFAAFFNYMRARNPNWEKECYESLLDKGLHMHQAKVSPHYYHMMKKIGRYYGQRSRTDALKFLNSSMRAQYLELKSLFSPEIFTISEYDFRKKHLKAYAFEV